MGLAASNLGFLVRIARQADIDKQREAMEKENKELNEARQQCTAKHNEALQDPKTNQKGFIA